MTEQTHIPHVWTQQTLSSQQPTPSAKSEQQTPSTQAVVQSNFSDPNPAFPATASLGMCTPLAVTQSAGNVFVTVSIPAEAIITLPTPALEIKRITKNLKITQCRFFNAIPPISTGQPQDTPKLFIGGFVRKDIQYSQVTGTVTTTTVQGSIVDFVVDIPISCVVNLGTSLTLPSTGFNQQQVYEFGQSKSLPDGFPTKENQLSGYLSEFNVASNEFLNSLPDCSLVYSQINEMDDALNRTALPNGPFEEGTFTMLQEKMIVVVQIKLSFPN